MPKSVEQKHPRFTDAELGRVKDVFADNDELITVCYKVFFQLPLTAEEQNAVSSTFHGSDLKSLFDKLFCPGLENEQLFFGVDDWYDIQIAEKSLAEAVWFISARARAIAYVKQQVNVLFGDKNEELKFSDFTPKEGAKAEDVYTNLIARKEIINKVRTLFGTLQVWAGKKAESKEEMMKRLFTNSNK